MRFSIIFVAILISASCCYGQESTYDQQDLTETVVDAVRDSDLTPEQKQALTQWQNNPETKKLMGKLLLERREPKFDRIVKLLTSTDLFAIMELNDLDFERIRPETCELLVQWLIDLKQSLTRS